MKQTAFFWDSNFVTWIIYKDYEGEGEKKKKSRKHAAYLITHNLANSHNETIIICYMLGHQRTM